MDELFSLHADPMFRRREALLRGYDDRDLVRALRAEQIRRVRQGAYVAAPIWDAADPIERYRLTGRAVCLRHGHRVMLSHTSAAVEHGLDLWKPDLSSVHVTRLDEHHGRVEAGVTHHTPLWTPDQLSPKDEILVTDAATAAVGTALLHSGEQSLVVTDSFLRLFPDAVDELLVAYRRVAGLADSRHLQITIRITEPGAGSVLETRIRYLMWRYGLPRPELQFHVYDGRGNLLGITDFAWPEHHLLGEADGRLKYGRLLGPNPTPQQISRVMQREKDREDALREATGFGMIRYTYADLAHPERTAERTRAMLARYGGLQVPGSSAS